MNRIGYIWNSFCTVENVKLAIELGTQHKRNARAVKRLLSYDKEVLQEHPELRGQLDPDKVQRISEEVVSMLENGEWQPHPYRHIRRYSPSTGKTREIDCPTLRDHIIHWMIILATKDAITRGMYKFSCGSIPGRGIEYARKTVEKWVRDKHSKYFVKLDIRKFYQSIDHEKLKAAFRKIIKDVKMLLVIDAVIDSLQNGLAIGNYTSQWFANFFLQPFDHFVLQQNYKIRRGKRVNFVRHYMRYMDDILFMGTSKRDLEKAVRAAIAFARDELGVEIKNCWEIKCFDDGDTLDIVGYRFTKEATTVRKSIFLHAKRLAKHIYKVKEKQGKIEPRNAQAMESLLGWFDHADSDYFNETYIIPYINENEIKEVISNESKKHSLAVLAG